MRQLRIGIHKVIFIWLLLLVIQSCKTKKAVANEGVNDRLNSKTIIKNHYRNALNFRTISGRMKIVYNDGKDEQSLVVSLRIEKDKTIWLSAPFGVVKALITPERVSFYNKLDNEYFDGDFDYLSNLLGTDLDYSKIQNLLLGQSILDLREDKYVSIPTADYYEIKPRKSDELYKTMFWLDPSSFKLSKQQLSQPINDRLLLIFYRSYQLKGNQLVPEEIDIFAKNSSDSTNIAIQFRSIEMNKPLNFPYKIPKGFQEIVLK
jgi:outer membrane lipoprotein-sorting protein